MEKILIGFLCTILVIQLLKDMFIMGALKICKHRRRVVLSLRCHNLEYLATFLLFRQVVDKCRKGQRPILAYYLA